MTEEKGDKRLQKEKEEKWKMDVKEKDIYMKKRRSGR